MIEQLQYATTPRYNFPQPIDDLQLPQKVLELSLGSMEGLKGESFQPCAVDFPELVLRKQEDEDRTPLDGKAFAAQLTPLKPITDDTPIIAIDVSSISIGETETGILCAIRGAVVWNKRKEYRYLRIGPFPFHINDESQKEAANLLRQYRFAISHSLDPVDMQSRLCNLVERWVQMSICCSSDNSIILWDGSLTAGTGSNPLEVISHLLKEARRRLNSVLAISKTTKIRFLGRKITDLFLKYPPPWLFEIEETNFPPSLYYLGRVYLAKFKSNGYSFRLDIDKILPVDEKIGAVQKLIGNDLVFQSYPESLRLAHIYSTFTANEVIGIQHYITHKYKMRTLTRPNIRKTLFGPFGTGFDD